MNNPQLEMAVAGFLAEESVRLQQVGIEISGVVIPMHVAHAKRAYRLGWVEGEMARQVADDQAAALKAKANEVQW